MRLRYLVLATALVMSGREMQAQGISLWLGAGRPVADSGALRIKNADLYAAAQLEAPLLPVALRVEGMVSAGNSIRTNPRSYFASAVVPLRLVPGITPYGIAGYGAYSYGKDREERGYNWGGGLKLGMGRTGFFGEVRRHQVLNKTQATVGMTF